VSLVLYNTLTRRKEPFEPLDPSRVRIYVCGPTVYDLPHIGNARPVVVFDVLYRLLRAIYGVGHVRYVRNITDVDDKINAAAKAQGISIGDLTQRTAAEFHADADALLCLPPDVEPRATQHIAPMIAMIERLIDKGFAYVADHHVLFAVAQLKDYGKLSRRSRDELIAGARVEVAPYKKDPADFVLWKPSPEDLPGWDSPWGRGRPGWHIECSAMGETHLGETFDIHAGGLDLIFPHHENEIAQSTAAHDGKPLARYWLHNGFVTVNGEKMAKSEGNFVTIRDVLAEAPGEAARYALLTSHYRDPLDWTEERLTQAKHALDRFYLALRDGGGEGAAAGAADPRVQSALEDDLNTPLALAALHELLAELNRAERPARAAIRASLRASAGLLGLLQQDPEAWLKGGVAGDAEIDALVQKRNEARGARNFAAADRIRTELALRGILLEDGPKGTTWRRG
jgi:cysteinyl-tRNA synthetase